MSLNNEHEVWTKIEAKGPGFTITRAKVAFPHTGKMQRAAQIGPNFVQHPAIARGLQLFSRLLKFVAGRALV